MPNLFIINFVDADSIPHCVNSLRIFVTWTIFLLIFNTFF